jgi:hypothetical protein
MRLSCCSHPPYLQMAKQIKLIPQTLSHFHKPRLLRTYTFPPLRDGNSKEDAVEAKIGEVEAEIQEVNVDIKSTKAKIDSLVSEIKCVVQSSAQNPVCPEYYQDIADQQRVHLDKERQLRQTKKQLRKTKKQLCQTKKQLCDEKARIEVERRQLQVDLVPVANLWSDGNLQIAARKALEAPYQDFIGLIQSLIGAVKKCRDSWQTCEDPEEKLYAQYIAVVQGSMMGKTRTFFILPQHNIYIFYICLRAQGPYPSGFDEIIKAFTRESCTEGFYAAFFLSGLQALNHFKRKQGASKPGSNSCSEWLHLQRNVSFWKPILGDIL